MASGRGAVPRRPVPLFEEGRGWLGGGPNQSLWKFGKLISYSEKAPDSSTLKTYIVPGVGGGNTLLFLGLLLERPTLACPLHDPCIVSSCVAHGLQKSLSLTLQSGEAFASAFTHSLASSLWPRSTGP